MNPRLIKRLVLAFLLAALLGGGLYGLSGGKDGAKSGKLETAAVTRGDVRETVTAQGKLEPKDYVDVGVQVSGQLKKLHVEIGDAVKQGDLIAELDPLPYESRVAADEAKLSSLKAQVLQKKAQEELDSAQLRRAETLIKSGAISKDEIETRATALKVTAATIQSLEAQANEAEANLESDKINLGYTKIYAPMDGIVADQIAREGQTLNANQTTPKLVQLADLNVMTVRAQIAEADVMRLRQGMEASFAPLGARDRMWKGTVRQILPTPQVINDVVLYDALIDVTNEDRQLMNGMSVQVFFEIARADNALTLPVRFLGKRLENQDNEKGRAYIVTVRKGSKSEKRTVYAGLMTRALAEIREGLAEGEEALMEGVDANPSAGNGKPKNSGPRPPIGPRL